MTEQNTPWPAVGDAAVLYTNRRGFNASVVEVTVTRIGKRDITLSNGERVPIATLQVRSKDPWSAPTYLMRPDDPQVLLAQAENMVAAADAKVAAAYETWWRTKTLEDLNAIGPAIATAIKARQHLQSTKDELAGKAS